MTLRKELCENCLNILRKYEKEKQKRHRLKVKEKEKQDGGKAKITYPHKNNLTRFKK
jgi:KaiC/GvpD/RAD55 family RecA-like ATPase